MSSEKKTGRIVVAEDDAAARKIMGDFLGDLGCEVVSFESGRAAWEHLSGHPEPDCLLLDVRLPEMDGHEVFRRVRERFPELPVILITAFGSTEEGVHAMKEGAHYYFTKPIDFLLLRRTVGELLEKNRLQRELSRVSADGARHGIVGQDPAMLEVVQQTALVADLPATVLITGETGTGKELVARAIHEGGRRRGGPFVAVNCAAVPENLLESELFGYEKGAFTGATQSKPGKLELADKGTLLLDEIGDMPMALQGKLLRILEDKVVERLGATRGRQVDVRFLAATHCDLESAVETGEFRRDLYFRLNLFRIELPPLRERLNDIPLLTSYFLARLCKTYERQVETVEPDVFEALHGHDWPGNVRELKHVLERALIVCDGTGLGARHLPRLLSSTSPGTGLPNANAAGLADLERQALVEALEKSGGNQAAAARELRISRNQIRYKIKKYGLDEA